MSGDLLSAQAWFDTGTAETQLVRGARLLRLHAVLEARGQLVVGQADATMPFVPRRFFVISQVPGTHIRGEHAHRELEQLLVCLAGSVVAEVDDGERRRSVVLDTARVGLHLGPMVWGVQHGYSRDAVLLVLASREYEAADYIREYPRYLELRRAR